MTLPRPTSSCEAFAAGAAGSAERKLRNAITSPGFSRAEEKRAVWDGGGQLGAGMVRNFILVSATTGGWRPLRRMID